MSGAIRHRGFGCSILGTALGLTVSVMPATGQTLATLSVSSECASQAQPAGSPTDIRAAIVFRARSDQESERFVAVTCALEVSLPERAGGRWVLTVRSRATTGLVTADLGTDSAIATDGPATDLELLTPPAFARGSIRVHRLDLAPAELTADVRVRFVANGKGDDGIDAFAGRGQSFQVSFPTTTYRNVVALARSVTMREPVSPTVKEEVHRVLSSLIARPADTWTRSATRSEPMVIFVGLSGANKIVLSDLMAWPMPAGKTAGGQRLAEPWQSTFERGSSFWAVYLEDVSSPFATSIDAQFTDAEPGEHDDFDPQSIARLDIDETGAVDRRVRVGFKRFRIPDQYDIALVTFSRQGAGYGLRQWGRTFTQYGRYPWRVAAGLFATIPTVTRRDFAVTPVFVDGALAPASWSIDVERTRQPVFATLALRFPQLRDSVRQTRSLSERLPRTLMPELILGMGIPTINRGAESLLAGASWPLMFDRLHVVAGVVTTRQPSLNQPFTLDRRLSNAVPLDELRTFTRSWKLVVGVGVDLLHTW